MSVEPANDPIYNNYEYSNLNIPYRNKNIHTLKILIPL